MQGVPVDRKVELTLSFLQKAGLVPDPAAAAVRAKLTEVVQAAGDRIKVAGDILDYSDFFRADDQLSYDEKAFDKRLRKPPEAGPLLNKFREQLRNAERFEAGPLEELLNAFVQAENVPISQIIHALRVAVTGKAVGFGLFETLATLGKEHCLARMDRALARVGTGAVPPATL